jgi:hypothetical protein
MAGDIGLYLKGQSWNTGTDTPYLTTTLADISIITVMDYADPNGTYYFTLEGEYIGNFDTERHPEYFASFKFELAGP